MDGKQYILGPMPTRNFLETFLGSNESALMDMPRDTTAFRAIPHTAKTEEEIYGKLVGRSLAAIVY